MYSCVPLSVTCRSVCCWSMCKWRRVKRTKEKRDDFATSMFGPAQEQVGVNLSFSIALTLALKLHSHMFAHTLSHSFLQFQCPLFHLRYTLTPFTITQSHYYTFITHSCSHTVTITLQQYYNIYAIDFDRLGFES